jgi:hypothetical protein
LNRPGESGDFAAVRCGGEDAAFEEIVDLGL